MTSKKLSNTTNEYFARLGAFAALVALSITIIAAVFAAWRYWGEDFIMYYTAARVFLRGGNPYDFHQVIAVTVELMGRPLNNPFYYSLWAIFPVLPFALLDLQTARLLWLASSALGWIAAMTILGRALAWHPASWARYVTWLVAFIVFEWTTIKPEQYATWLLLALAILLWAIRTQHNFFAAVALVLLLTKFNVTFFLFGALYVFMWFTHRPIAVRALLTLIALVTLSTLLVPDWYQPIIAGEIPHGWEQGLNGFEIEGGRMNTTTRDLIRYGLGLPDWVGWIIAAGFALIASYCLWHWRSHKFFFALLATTFGLLITPVAVQYDYAVLAAPFVWIVSRWDGYDTRARALVIIGTLFMVSVLFWESPVYDGLWIPVMLTILLLVTAPRVLENHLYAQSYSA